ncbi:MAG: hypothetical protein ABS942_15880 [Solibacillus sp.]
MNQLIQSFEKDKDAYEYCERKIAQVVEDICKFENLSIHKIESRVKKVDSLEKKIEKKNKYTEIDQITDIVGIRIITLFEDEVDNVAAVLKKEFEIDVENSADKRIKENPETFGYASLHYVLSLKEPRKSLSEFALIKDISFEVQVRSVLQHAWAEIEHDLGYKSNSEIPRHIRRNFSRVSSLLEAADIEFVRIKEELEKYKSQLQGEINVISNYSDIELDKLSVLEYLKTSDDIQEVTNEMTKELNYPLLDDEFITLSAMKLFNIANINELDSIVKRYKTQMIKFGLRWKREREANPNITYYFILLTLFYVLLYLEHDDEMLCEFLESSGISKKYHDRIKELFANYKEEKFLINN